MEKIFNLFRSTNHQNNIFVTSKTLMLNVVNPDGRVTRMLSSSTSAEIISCVPVEFSDRAVNVYKQHHFVHVRSGNVINYNTSMEAAGVADNDEIYLLSQHEATNYRTDFNRRPSQAQIDALTGNFGNSSEVSSNINSNFIKEIVGEHSYIRNFLIQLAIESAFIISTGPHADFLIEYFKQKIIGGQTLQNDAVTSLTELGFERSRCAYAIKLNKNIYSEALNWLIDHSEDSNTYRLFNSSVSLIKPITTNFQDKFKSLNQIIRIYGRCGQHHCEELLEMFLGMGFEKEESLNALRTSDWDPTQAVDILCREQRKSFKETTAGSR